MIRHEMNYKVVEKTSVSGDTIYEVWKKPDLSYDRVIGVLNRAYDGSWVSNKHQSYFPTLEKAVKAIISDDDMFEHLWEESEEQPVYDMFINQYELKTYLAGRYGEVAEDIGIHHQTLRNKVNRKSPLTVVELDSILDFLSRHYGVDKDNIVRYEQGGSNRVEWVNAW